MEIRACERADIAQVCAIYNYYILNTIITFEEDPVSELEMQARVESCQKQYPWLVCCENGVVVGFAYAGQWKARSAYRHSAEATVYLQHDSVRRGFGRALYTELLAQLRQQQCHVVLACIAMPNDASVALHESFGFRPVALFPEVGRKFNRWLDVGYWQLNL